MVEDFKQITSLYLKEKYPFLKEEEIEPQIGSLWALYIKNKAPDFQRWINKRNKELQPKKDDEETPPEKLVYDFVMKLDVDFCSDQFSNECVLYNKKYYGLTSREFKASVASLYFKENDCVFSDQAWNKFLNIVSNECVLNVKYFPIRCYTKDDALYYDTGQAVWKFYNGEVEIYTANDANCPIIFRRYNHQLPAEIKPTTRTTKEIIQEIVQDFNIQDFRPETLPLFFCSEQPHPINLITGDPGAAKSTWSLFIKQLVDPDQVDKLTIPEKNNIADFGMHRQQFYLLLYDNVRVFYQEQSDELCRMVTGGTSITRKLYTNGELYVMKGLPRIVVNGLRPEPSSFNDLLDRTLLFDMNRIAKSKPERLVWKKINDLIPELRFACLRDMSMAIIMAYEQEFPKMPRMSEYCLLGESLNVLWGGELGEFVNWFNRKMDVAHASGMDDPFIVVLLDYLRAHRDDIAGKDGLSYSSSEWRFKLEEYATEKKIGFNYSSQSEYKTNENSRPELAMCVQEKDWPKNATWLGRRFRDISPLLLTLGYRISVDRNAKENKISLRLV